MILAYIGSEVNILCNYDNPVWLKNYKPIDQVYMLDMKENSSLTIKINSEQDDGIYICRGKDRSGETSQVITSIYVGSKFKPVIVYYQ